MREDEEKYIVYRREKDVVIKNIPEEYINNGHKLIIRLKENCAEYEYLFKKK